MTNPRLAIAMFAIALGAITCDDASDSAHANSRVVSVYAAASLAAVLQATLDALDVTTENQIGIDVKLISGASSTLARQLERGAPPGIYISASRAWMSHLEQKDRLIEGTRRSLYSNRLIIAESRALKSGEASQSFEGSLETLPELGAADLRELFSARAPPPARVCMGAPDHVPAGIYGRSALQSSRAWEAVRDRILPGADARRTVWYLSRGACALGIIYRTDAIESAGIVPLALVSRDLHESIVYEVALVKNAPQAARELYDFFVFAPEAHRISQRFGFVSIR